MTRHYGLSHHDSVRSGQYQAVPPESPPRPVDTPDWPDPSEDAAAEARAAARRSKARSIIIWCLIPWIGAAVLILIALFGGGVIAP